MQRCKIEAAIPVFALKHTSAMQGQYRREVYAQCIELDSNNVSVEPVMVHTPWHQLHMHYSSIVCAALNKRKSTQRSARSSASIHITHGFDASAHSAQNSVKERPLCSKSKTDGAMVPDNTDFFSTVGWKARTRKFSPTDKSSTFFFKTTNFFKQDNDAQKKCNFDNSASERAS